VQLLALLELLVEVGEDLLATRAVTRLISRQAPSSDAFAHEASSHLAEPEVSDDLAIGAALRAQSLR